MVFNLTIGNNGIFEETSDEIVVRKATYGVDKLSVTIPDDLDNVDLTGAYLRLEFCRPGGAANPSAMLTLTDGIVEYTLEQWCTTYAGVGEFELAAYYDQSGSVFIWRSGKWTYVVEESVYASGTMPEPTEEWLAEVNQAIDDAADAKADAATAVQAATTANEKSDAAILTANEAAADAAHAVEVADAMPGYVLDAVGAHNVAANAHTDIRQAVQTAESIARGRATAHVFDTYADMVTWLADPDNVATMVTGDNLYIRDTGVKDYWWDGEAAQILEAEAPDLTDYYTKTQVDAMMPITLSRSAYDALIAAGTWEPGRRYDIYEDPI